MQGGIIINIHWRIVISLQPNIWRTQVCVSCGPVEKARALFYLSQFSCGSLTKSERTFSPKSKIKIFHIFCGFLAKFAKSILKVDCRGEDDCTSHPPALKSYMIKLLLCQNQLLYFKIKVI